MSQNYQNHKRFHTLYHFITVPLILAGLVLAIYSFAAVPTIITGLLALAFLLILAVAIFARIYALKAQDRAARAEEKLRYFILTGKTLPQTLRLGQILALRFASDEEFVDLVKKAAAENLSPGEIKKSIQNWRGDYHRI